MCTFSGTARTAGGSVAICVYTTVLVKVQSSHALDLVPKAVIGAGGTAKMATEVLAALPLGSSALEKVPGITTKIAGAAGLAFQESYRLGLRYVRYFTALETVADFLRSAIALTTVGFGIVLIIAVLCCNDIGHKMNNKIEVFLENDVYAAKNEFHEELHVNHGIRRRSSAQAG